MADLDRIKRNVAKMASQNAPIEDIDGYIASEGVELDDVRNFKPEAGVGNPTPPTSQEGTFQPSTVLPLGKDTATGEISWAVPGAIAAIPGLISGAARSAVDAAMLPGRAYNGEIQLTGPDGRPTQEAIEQAANFAMWASPASPAQSMPLSPTVRAARPKPEGLQVAEAGQRLGVDLPRAATSDSMTIQQAGKTIANAPFAGSPLRKASADAVEGLKDAAVRVREGYGTGSVANAGGMARDGIENYAKTTLGDRVKASYDAVDGLVTQNVVTPLNRTAKIAGEILSSRTNSQVPGRSRAVGLVEKALSSRDGLNYQGLKDLRTSVGELLENPSLIPSNMSQAELKRIYGGLTDDLRNAVARAGGEKATKAFDDANALAASVAKEREALQSVLGRQTSDEGIFSRIEAMAGSTARADQNGLMKVRGAVGKDTWDEIASGVIARLGNEGSGNFSPDQFLTKYNKLSNTGKSLLFGGKQEFAKSLEDIATVSQRFKQLNQYANPSGTAGSALTGIAGYGLASNPMGTIASLVGGRALSSVLAKPRSAKSLANWAKAYEEATLNPSVKTTFLLDARAKVLATELAAETGGTLTRDQILPSISRVGQVQADDGNEDQGAQENKQGRVPAQPRRLLPNET